MNGVDTQSRVISALRYPLVVMVLLIHSNFKGISSAWDGALAHCFSVDLGDMTLSVDSFITFVSGTLAPLANPFFFFLSGLLFFREGTFSRALYLRKLCNRVRSLLVPYVIWNALVLFLLYIGETLRPDWTPIIDRPIANFGLTDYLLVFWDISRIGCQGGIAAPVDIPLWFVRDLMIVSVLSPLIYAAVRWISSLRWEVSVLLLAAFLALLRRAPEVPGIHFQGIVFFAFGSYFSISGRRMLDAFRPALLGIFLSLFFLQRNQPHLLYASLIVAIVSLVARWIESRQKRGKKPSRLYRMLTDAAFFILAGHTLALGIVVQALKTGWLVPTTGLEALAVYLLCPVFLTVSMLLVFLLLCRFLPSVSSCLTGGRAENSRRKD